MTSTVCESAGEQAEVHNHLELDADFNACFPSFLKAGELSFNRISADFDRRENAGAIRTGHRCKCDRSSCVRPLCEA
jgi:hypothetical protein